MKKRYVQIDGELVEVTKDYSEPVAPMVWGDLPAYESPVTGQMVEGRVQRREDLKRTNSRPWEGLEAERKEAERRKQYLAQQEEKSLEKAAWSAYFQLSPRKREILRGRK
jgi:hypothetical protein